MSGLSAVLTSCTHLFERASPGEVGKPAGAPDTDWPSFTWHANLGGHHGEKYCNLQIFRTLNFWVFRADNPYCSNVYTLPVHTVIKNFAHLITIHNCTYEKILMTQNFHKLWCTCTCMALQKSMGINPFVQKGPSTMMKPGWGMQIHHDRKCVTFHSVTHKQTVSVHV